MTMSDTENFELPPPQPRPAPKCPYCLETLTFNDDLSCDHQCKVPDIEEQKQAFVSKYEKLQEQWYQDLLTRLKFDIIGSSEFTELIRQTIAHDIVAVASQKFNGVR